jgi:ATP-dependent DNA helicase RecG
MDPKTRNEVMTAFAQGELKLLVSTTVIEVGVDVPRATIMVIENAESFGLAQLHQLRGRVGRGPKGQGPADGGFGESHCFLFTDAPAGSPADHRLRFFCKEYDGFAIADADLRLRGPGETLGTQQSGWEDLRCADILRDADLFREIQQELDLLLDRKDSASGGECSCRDGYDRQTVGRAPCAEAPAMRKGNGSGRYAEPGNWAEKGGNISSGGGGGVVSTNI